jgi:hypothetical protein
MRQPVLKRVAHGVPPSWPQPEVQLLVEFLELVADLDLGLAADLLADARRVRVKVKVYSPDISFPGFVPVDRVHAMLGLWAASPSRG